MIGRDGGPLRRRLEQLAREFAKFGTVGGLGLLVDLGLFNLLCHFMDVPVVPGGIIATVVAIGFNYLGFRYFTYRERDKDHKSRELTLFLLFSAIGLVIQSGVLYVATSGFGWDSPLQSNAFKFLGIGIATVFRFWSYRTWVFQKLPVPRDAAQAAGPFLDDPRVVEGDRVT